MTFVQIIDYKTDKVDDFNRLMDRWVEQTQGRGRPRTRSWPRTATPTTW